MAEPTALNLTEALVPRNVTAAMQTTAMSATSRAYSTSEAPRSVRHRAYSQALANSYGTMQDSPTNSFERKARPCGRLTRPVSAPLAADHSANVPTEMSRMTYFSHVGLMIREHAMGSERSALDLAQQGARQSFDHFERPWGGERR